MAPDATTTTPPAARPRPEWLRDFTSARIEAFDYLTPVERDLLDAVALLIHARTGKTQLPEAKAVARMFVRDAMDLLNNETAK